eukprot:scaffold4409_cov369-Prasinococcus_capsulatus_cf.AAC.15
MPGSAGGSGAHATHRSPPQHVLIPTSAESPAHLYRSARRAARHARAPATKAPREEGKGRAMALLVRR